MKPLENRPHGFTCWHCGRTWMLNTWGVYTLYMESDVICDCRLKGSKNKLMAIPQQWAIAMAGY